MRIFNNNEFNVLPMPTDIHFGFGIAKKLPELLKKKSIRRVFIVTDKGLRNVGIVDLVADYLIDGGIKVGIFDEVQPDSGTKLINEATNQVKDFAADSVIGLGGGSSLDTAKAAALMAVVNKPLSSYLGLGNVDKKPLPIIAIPTTAGTGSEVSLWSVFTDDETGKKVAAGSVLLYPELAICDPELTFGLPSSLTATTGMDALTHAIECYVNNACQPISGALSLRAIKIISKNLRKVVRNGQDRGARYQMLLASTMAGIAMNSTRLGLAHALAMPLGSDPFNIPHGEVNAILLPHVMKFNSIAEPERYRSVASAVNNQRPNTTDEAADMIFKLANDIGIPKGLKAVGFDKDAIPLIAEEAIKSGNIKVNPRLTTQEDLEQILLKAL